MIKRKSTVKIIIFISIILICEFLISLFIGQYPLTISNLLCGDGQSWRVFMTLRLPRTCMAVIGGFGLGAAGMVYQTVFRNPLASPDIIGVASGASTGAAFAILFLSSSVFYITLSAFAGSLIAVAAALILSSAARGNDKSSLVLSGIAVHALAQTVLMALKITADPEKQLASIEYWIMGSLNAITLNKLPSVAIILLISSAAVFLLYRQVLLLSADRDEAALLGVSVSKMRAVILILATLMVSSVISVTGLISFVGLLAPHSARLVTKDNRLNTLVCSGLIGACILTAADMFARGISSSELPLSIFTSLLGAPFMLYLLMRKGDKNG